MPDNVTQPGPGEGDANSRLEDAEARLRALQTTVADLQARLEAFERILQLRDAAVAALPAEAPLPPAALPTRYDVTADQLLAAQDGFYQLEWGPEGAFRWTGPGADVHFEAWIDRSAPLVATLQLFHFGAPPNAQEMTLLVDGTTYALSRQDNGKVLTSEPIAPAEADGPTRVTLRVPHVHSPSSRGAKDRRVLGVAFQRLTIDRA